MINGTIRDFVVMQYLPKSDVNLYLTSRDTWVFPINSEQARKFPSSDAAFEKILELKQKNPETHYFMENA